MGVIIYTSFKTDLCQDIYREVMHPCRKCSVNAFVFLTSALWVPISPCRKCSVKSFVRWFKRQDLYLLHYFSFGLVRHKFFLQQFFQGKVPLRHLIRYGQWTFWWSLYEDLTSNKYKWFHPKYISLLTTLT